MEFLEHISRDPALSKRIMRTIHESDAKLASIDSWSHWSLPYASITTRLANSLFSSPFTVVCILP